MTKAELISLISKNTGIEKTEVLNIVTSYMNTIKKSLEEGENVYLRGFGSFIVKKRAEKKARNISKNTTIIIPEHSIPAFKPARVFMEAIASDKKKAKKKK
ncbi:MAG: integration host factor subunit beta [Tannerella sp.]|jgi:DNA-binding protein HU-beta|nr:integration host factor subunit beta [Tannerella sp.]